jgi:RNA-directed DNA polymerase
MIKRKVADEPLMTFKRRIRQLTRRSGGCSVQDVVDHLRPYIRVGRRTSGWRKHHGSGESSTSGCVIGRAPSSSSSGSAVRPCTGNVARQVAANSRRWWRNSGMLLNAVLTLNWSDRLGLPRLS